MNSIKTPANTPEKILIIRLSSIGDILLSTPFIRQIRKTFPNAKIDFIVKDIYKELLTYNPYIDELYSLKLDDGHKELNQLKVKLNDESYDVVFDLHNNMRSNYLKKGIHSNKTFSIKKDKIKQSLLVFFKINLYDKETPIPLRYLSVARDYGVSDDEKGLDLFWKDETKETAEKKAILMGLELNRSYICMAPGAGFFTKRWPEEKFVNLVDLFQRDNKHQIIVLGDHNDKEIGISLNRKKKIIDLCGKLSLLETAHIISKGEGVVSNDSGLMHMATAVKTPVSAIFGSTVRELGFFPYRAKSVVSENTDLACRPCSHIGRKTCPKNHFKCMSEISPEQVYTGLMKFL